MPEADIRGITPQRDGCRWCRCPCKQKIHKNAGDDANSSGVTRFSVVFGSVNAPMAQNLTRQQMIIICEADAAANAAIQMPVSASSSTFLPEYVQ